MIGVSKTCQVFPRSGEWKTRATLPPVANQMFGSGAGAEAPSFSCSDAALKRRSSTGMEAVDVQEVRTVAMQVLLAAKAPSPSMASGNCDGGIGCQVWP